MTDYHIGNSRSGYVFCGRNENAEILDNGRICEECIRVSASFANAVNNRSDTIKRLQLIMAMAGHPSAAEACRNIIEHCNAWIRELES